MNSFAMVVLSICMIGITLMVKYHMVRDSDTIVAVYRNRNSLNRKPVVTNWMTAYHLCIIITALMVVITILSIIHHLSN